MIHSTDTHPSIKINTVYQPLAKLKCKDLYWHLIQQKTHTPSAVNKWITTFPVLKEASDEVWSRIFKMPFNSIRETKYQSFQYKIVHRIIACNKWLCNIKIKDNSKCTFCNEEDSIEHFFLYCQDVKLFWSRWHNWWDYTTGLSVYKSEVIAECILLGFPGDDDVIQVLNYCVLIAKHYIYSQKLQLNGNPDLLQYLCYLKHKLSLEKQVCTQNSNSNCFDKYDIIYDML